MADQAPVLRPALILALVGLAAAALLAGLNELTRDRIVEERQQRALASVAAMLTEDSYDNDLLDDTVTLRVPGLEESATIYRARLEGSPVAVVMDVTTPHGYSGEIRLLAAADVDGRILAVRILEHRETPGLGDKIERSRSGWIDQFNGRSLGNPPAEYWAPDRRGGQFDTMTSATITASAVVDAVKLALQAFEANRESLLASPDNTDN